MIGPLPRDPFSLLLLILALIGVVFTAPGILEQVFAFF